MIISGMHMYVAKFFLLIISTIFLIFSHNGIFEGPKCQLCLSDLWVFVWPCPTWNYFRLYRKMLIFFFQHFTLFENHPKCCIWIFEFWHFPPIFVLLKLTCLVTLFDSGFQKLAKMDHFWHFWLTFVHSKCKRSSLRSQCWMPLFLWF